MLKLNVAKYRVPCHTKGCYNKAAYSLASEKGGLNIASICESCALALYECLKATMPKPPLADEPDVVAVTVTAGVEKKKVGRPRKEEQNG